MTVSTVGIARPELLTDEALRNELRERSLLSESFIDSANHVDLVNAVRQVRIEASVKAKPLLICDPDTYDYTFDGHAGAGPSSSERWMTCTASLQASREFLGTLTPVQQHTFANSNTAARQGTTAHAVAEAELSFMLGYMDSTEHTNTLHDLALSPPDGEEYDEEMAEHLTTYTDYVSQLTEDGYEITIEDRVTALVPLLTKAADVVGEDYYEVRGSGDCTGVPPEDGDTLVVADLKYGNGIDVSVHANPQVRIYGLGKLQSLVDDEGNLPARIKWIEYAIIQPRLGGVKVWKEPVDALLDWRDQHLSPALSNALLGTDGGAVFRPSDDACQFCPARGGCAALAEQRVAEADELFDVVGEADFNAETIDAPLLDSDRLGDLLAQANAIVALGKDLKAEAQRRLLRGEDVKGFDLRNYSPPRSWVEGADARLTQTKYPQFWHDEPVLLSPTQVLALLKSEKVTPSEKLLALIETPDKKPVISSGPKDKRKVWEGRAPEALFPDDLDES